MGSVCKGKKLLPQAWDLDHDVPLHMGGSNYYNFDDPKDPKNNLVVKCPLCHAVKTQKERIFTYSLRRKKRFEALFHPPESHISCYFDKNHPKYLKPVQVPEGVLSLIRRRQSFSGVK